MRRPAAGSLALLTLLAGAGCGSSAKTATQGGVPAAAAPTASTASGVAHANAGSANVVSAQTGTIVATMHGGTHTPRAGERWLFSFAVTRAGAPARASVSYQYLLAGQVVARRSHYTFTGHFNDFTFWPAASVGYPLTLRAVIVAGSATINLDYPVQVTR